MSLMRVATAMYLWVRVDGMELLLSVRLCLEPCTRSRVAAGISTAQTKVLQQQHAPETGAM
jgi:hypothetical protein